MVSLGVKGTETALGSLDRHIRCSNSWVLLKEPPECCYTSCCWRERPHVHDVRIFHLEMQSTSSITEGEPYLICCNRSNCLRVAHWHMMDTKITYGNQRWGKATLLCVLIIQESFSHPLTTSGYKWLKCRKGKQAMHRSFRQPVLCHLLQAVMFHTRPLHILNSFPNLTCPAPSLL